GGGSGDRARLGGSAHRGAGCRHREGGNGGIGARHMALKPRKRPPPMAKREKRFDAVMKHLLELFPSAGPALLGLRRRRRVSVLNADLATVTTLADKVFRVHDPQPWILHIEFLSSHRYRLPPSLAAYNTLLDNRHA